MKVFGIILIIAGIGGVCQFIASEGQAPISIGWTTVFLVLGIYLVYRVNQNKIEEQDRDRWINGK